MPVLPGSVHATDCHWPVEYHSFLVRWIHPDCKEPALTPSAVLAQHSLRHLEARPPRKRNGHVGVPPTGPHGGHADFVHSFKVLLGALFRGAV